MQNLINYFLSTEYWPPRWYCGNWSEGLGWTHIISDTLIFLAYFAIPIVLLFFYFRIKEARLDKIFICFSLFILFCGIGHLIEATIFYYPVYRLAALNKAITALISWVTVLVLVPYIREFLKLPKLKVVNKQLSEELEEERTRLRLAYEGTNAGLLDWNLNEGTCSFSGNFCKLLKLSETKISSNIEFFYSKIHDEDREHVVQSIEEHLRTGKLLREDCRLLLEDGTYRWFEFFGKSNRLEQSQRSHFVGSIIDIHERIQAEEDNIRLCNELQASNQELKNANQALQEFSFHIAHDLKEPIRGIGTYSLILSDEEFSQNFTDEIKEKLQKIRLLSTRSQQMIEDLLTLSKINNTQEDNTFESLEKMIESVSVTLEHADRSHIIEQDTPLPFLKCNRILMIQALQNLIGNGLKFNDRQDKKISIGYIHDAKQPSFYVKDNGLGISDGDSKKVFDVFYRGQTTKNKEGSGVGLAITRKIIKNLGGSIQLESTLGEGTTFYISFPAAYFKVGEETVE